MAPAIAAMNPTTKSAKPDFMQKIDDDYQAQVAHVFTLTGNIYDFVDNGGTSLGMKNVLASWYDDNIQSDLGGGKTKHKDTGLQDSLKTSSKTRIMAFYNTSGGLEFPNPKSKDQWIAAHKAVFGDAMDDWGANWHNPKSPEAALSVINRWFFVSKQLAKENMTNRKQGMPMSMELVLTLVFTDSDSLFPRGDIANLSQDRQAIVYIRNWAQDEYVGARNRIILMSRHVTDIHESIRGELAVGHTVRKPNLQDRLEWITNFNAYIVKRVQAQGGTPLTVGQNADITKINLAPDFDMNEFAVQSAGMNRRQIKDVILNSWRSAQEIDFPLVQERKKRALDDEYNGMINILEPKFGFDQIGGHEHFKDYCRKKIIKPLKAGNKRDCSRGVLMTGPPGTGKSMIAWALAKEAGLNFIIVDLGKVFGGLVGETEANVRKLIEAIEAASPCIVFIDEIDSVLASGRSGGGDSGTSARVFSSFMTWLSDPGRVGKVVVLAATNRPDLLDDALIRSGRLDVKIPMLPPAKGDAQGRWNILAALTKKYKITLHPELIGTRDNPKLGLGPALHDSNRLWTGAEIEQLLQAAYDEAVWAERMVGGKLDTRITVADFEAAFAAVIPRTGAVELQTNLALEFTNDLRFCPKDWKDAAIVAIRRREEREAAAIAA